MVTIGELNELTQRAFNETAARRSLEYAAIQRQSDADRRHEQRLVALSEAIRAALARNDQVFAPDADVPAMAAAAVGVYEQKHGK